MDYNYCGFECEMRAVIFYLITPSNPVLVFLKYYLTFNRKYDPVKYIRKTYFETII